MIARLLATVALALVCGCEGIGIRVIEKPGRDEVLRVVSGDRIYFDLEENAAAGYTWDYVCDDPDVEVTIDHVAASGIAKVRIRIHRGYDGPSNVHFTYRRPREKGRPEKDFDIGLYKRTGDVAFWE
jgi:predicted secreted protein